jgi:organic radical activating enzyme
MIRVHAQTREVLVEVSPLIETTRNGGGNGSVFVPLHTLEQRERRADDGQPALSPLHDFMRKLRQPAVIEQLRAYVRWQAAWRTGYRQGMSFEHALESAPDHAPLSINLDATTACNYRCDHCVDMDILNTGIRFDHERLKDSLDQLAAKGLRSVIIIGGGEPTVYPGFTDLVGHLKGLGIQLGIVTNGSRMDRVEAVADALDGADWVRLSLDSGTNETFATMHKPHRESITLDWICDQIPAVKARNPALQIGFSFIIAWNECRANDADIIDNVEEIVPAARLAREHGFDYISYKPFLIRAQSNNAEIVELSRDGQPVDPVMARIRIQVDQAKTLQTDSFRVVESTNLRVFENGSHRDYCDQPRNCHMQFFRQVLSPLGIYNCPVYRHVPHALLGGKHACSTAQGQRETLHNTLRLIESFDASRECQEVTCLYNDANWFIEDLVRNPDKLDALEASGDRGDYFL